MILLCKEKVKFVVINFTLVMKLIDNNFFRKWFSCELIRALEYKLSTFLQRTDFLGGTIGFFNDGY